MMKLRLLNGSHSSIAYLGQLAGWGTVGEAMTEPAVVRHVTALMQEVAATFAVPTEIDVAAYQRSLLTRFANSALPHRTAQIAMDGSQKLPQRLFPPALTRCQSGRGSPRIALAIAAWLRFLRGRSENGSTLALDDPLAPRLKEAAAGTVSNSDLVDRIFRISDVVPVALAQSSFRTEVLAALDKLAANGVRETLSAMAP
jgi:fructuronate reductase